MTANVMRSGNSPTPEARDLIMPNPNALLRTLRHLQFPFRREHAVATAAALQRGERSNPPPSRARILAYVVALEVTFGLFAMAAVGLLHPESGP